jgi:transposase
MPKSRPPYPPEFRQRIIELVRKGRTPESLAEQFEPTAQTIRNWLAQADRDAGQRPDGLTTDEREELRRLRRENKTLREEREILSASCWTAAASRPRPRPGWPSSTSSRAGTTRIGAIQAWTTSRRSAMNNGTQSSRSAKAVHRPRNRGNSSSWHRAELGE